MEIQSRQGLRLVTWNVNGIRTVFNYHPWTQLRSLSAMFDFFQADIITLQELKVALKDVSNTVGIVPGFQSYVSVPAEKKGYSGVGVYVRIPLETDPWHVKQALSVVKAEEGITGMLTSYDTKKRYIESPESVGGYPALDPEVATAIDREGRCVVLEMATNTVIISVYCPANSTGTEDGELYRLQFIEAVLSRIWNLSSMGKHVVLMGDLNIARDLIDRADKIGELSKVRRLSTRGDLEEENKLECIAFTKSTIPRLLLNEILIDSLGDTSNPVLIDTVRRIQGRRRGLYTVWNTLRNSRPGNYGSRVDYILGTEKLAQCTKIADIWPKVMGSDHCPVFTDFDMTSLCDQNVRLTTQTPKFEAKYVYKLLTGNIGTMFAMAKKRKAQDPPAKPSQNEKEKKKSKKEITSFFKKRGVQSDSDTPYETPSMSSSEESTPSEEVQPESSEVTLPLSITNTTQSNSILTNGKFGFNGAIPKCRHLKECALKTAMTPENKGRKFWTCAKPKGEIVTPEDDANFSCGFFQWRS